MADNSGVNWASHSTGNRDKDASPPVPTKGESQPILTTETYGAIPDSIKLDHGNSGNREGTAVNPDMPTGGTIPDSSTDIEDPTAHP